MRSKSFKIRYITKKGVDFMDDNKLIDCILIKLLAFLISGLIILYVLFVKLLVPSIVISFFLKINILKSLVVYISFVLIVKLMLYLLQIKSSATNDCISLEEFID